MFEKRQEPIYCKHCGYKLEPDDRVTGYDEYTGIAIRPFLHEKCCPVPTCPSRRRG